MDKVGEDKLLIDRNQIMVLQHDRTLKNIREETNEQGADCLKLTNRLAEAVKTINTL